MTLAALLGLAIRLVNVFVNENPAPLLGDAFQYHVAANFLAHGHAWVDPFWLIKGTSLPSAFHPPAFYVVLAAASKLGFDTALDHEVWCSILGAITVVLVGFAGRRVAGTRVGIVAALLAAVAPTFWINDGLVMSETLLLLVVAAVVLCAYRFVDRPSYGRIAVLGVTCGLAALTRAEDVLLIVVLIVPLTLTRRSLTPSRRLATCACGLAAAAITIAPWSIYNATRFTNFEPLTTSLGRTMWGSNCDPTYRGDLTGYWLYVCSVRGPATAGDESVVDKVDRQWSLHYMRRHVSDLPAVMYARLGRTFGFYRPYSEVAVEGQDGRGANSAKLGLLLYDALVPLAIAGLFVLYARRRTVIPLVAPFLTTAAATLLTYGQTRVRASAEVALVILASVTIDALAREVEPLIRNRLSPAANRQPA